MKEWGDPPHRTRPEQARCLGRVEGGGGSLRPVYRGGKPYKQIKRS